MGCNTRPPINTYGTALRCHGVEYVQLSLGQKLHRPIGVVYRPAEISVPAFGIRPPTLARERCCHTRDPAKRLASPPGSGSASTSAAEAGPTCSASSSCHGLR